LQSFSGYTHAAADQLEAHLAGVTVIESGGALSRAAKKPLKPLPTGTADNRALGDCLGRHKIKMLCRLLSALGTK
jgi:hypothetical protein